MEIGTEMSLAELGAIVFRKRGERGLTQTEFGHLIGKDQGYVSRLERGVLKEYPDPDTTDRLANELGRTVRDVLETIGYRIEDAPAPPVEGLRRIDLGDPSVHFWAGGEVDEFAENVIRLWFEQKRKLQE